MRKYTKDFKIEVVKDENGREKTKAVYYGPFFEISLDEQGLHFYKLTCFLFLMVIVGFHIGAGFAANQGMYQFYVALPYVIAFFPLLYLTMGIFRIPQEKRVYRRDEVGHSFGQIKSSSISLLIIFGVGLIGEIVFLLLVPAREQLSPDFLYLALELIAAAAAYLFFRAQRIIVISTLKD